MNPNFKPSFDNLDNNSMKIDADESVNNELFDYNERMSSSNIFFQNNKEYNGIFIDNLNNTNDNDFMIQENRMHEYVSNNVQTNDTKKRFFNGNNEFDDNYNYNCSNGSNYTDVIEGLKDNSKRINCNNSNISNNNMNSFQPYQYNYENTVMNSESNLFVINSNKNDFYNIEDYNKDNYCNEYNNNFNNMNPSISKYDNNKISLRVSNYNTKANSKSLANKIITPPFDNNFPTNSNSIFSHNNNMNMCMNNTSNSISARDSGKYYKFKHKRVIFTTYKTGNYKSIEEEESKLKKNAKMALFKNSNDTRTRATNINNINTNTNDSNNSLEDCQNRNHKSCSTLISDTHASSVSDKTTNINIKNIEEKESFNSIIDSSTNSLKNNNSSNDTKDNSNNITNNHKNDNNNIKDSYDDSEDNKYKISDKDAANMSRRDYIKLRNKLAARKSRSLKETELSRVLSLNRALKEEIMIKDKIILSLEEEIRELNDKRSFSIVNNNNYNSQSGNSYCNRCFLSIFSLAIIAVISFCIIATITPYIYEDGNKVSNSVDYSDVAKNSINTNGESISEYNFINSKTDAEVDASNDNMNIFHENDEITNYNDEDNDYNNSELIISANYSFSQFEENNTDFEEDYEDYDDEEEGEEEYFQEDNNQGTYKYNYTNNIKNKQNNTSNINTTQLNLNSTYYNNNNRIYSTLNNNRTSIRYSDNAYSNTTSRIYDSLKLRENMLNYLISNFTEGVSSMLNSSNNSTMNILNSTTNSINSSNNIISTEGNPLNTTNSTEKISITINNTDYMKNTTNNNRFL